MLLDYVDDETLDIYMHGVLVAHLNHDLHGWAGMENIRDAFLKVAEVDGLTVTVKGEPNV